MAENEYSELKSRIEELIENITILDKEAVSFSVAKGNLITIASNLQNISADLEQVIKNSNVLLNEVESLSVKATIQSMRQSAEVYTNVSNELIKDIKSFIDNKESNMQKKMDDLTTNIKFKFLILGGLCVIVSVVSILLSIF